MSKVLLVCKGARLHKILGPAMFNVFCPLFDCEKVRGIFDLPSERHGFICGINSIILLDFMVRNRQTFKQIGIAFISGNLEQTVFH